METFRAEAAATLAPDKVADIAVDGDTATADTTITFVVGDAPPHTETTEVKLVREDGNWKDCTPPSEAE
jgi:hypothetical protein